MDHNRDTDISLKDLVLKIRHYLQYLSGRWKTIALSGVLFAAFFLFLNIGNPEIYTARLNFMLNVDERGLNSGIAALVGQFGFGLSPSENNLDKILELSRSRRIAELALFDSIEIKGNSDLLANQLIANLEKYHMWAPGSFLGLGQDTIPMDDFRFTHTNTDIFDVKENKALKLLHDHLNGSDKTEALLKTDYNELTGIMSLSLSTPSETLSILGATKIFDALSRFYILKSTEKQQYEYDILLDKYDSIYTVLGSVQYQLARFEDGNRDLFRKQDMLKKEQLQVEQQKLQYMISKAEEQLQLAKIALDNKTPYIQLIDRPISPIEADNKPLLFFPLVGFIFGVLVAVAVYLIRKIYQDIISE